MTGAFTDLSGVRILRCGVDTVRQLYNGKLRPEVMALFDLSVDVVEFAGYEWSKGRIGRDSGYQYRLQNAELGLILLIKNHNIKVDTLGSHLKIEVSPHALDGADPHILQGVLDDLAAAVLSHCETNQAAVHIALDVQGWKPPRDLVDRMHCRSCRVRQISGIERIEFDGNASVYGRGETYMFGSANGLQLSIYNKTLQARATDKLDYWESVWATLNGDPFGDGDPAYNPWKRCGGSNSVSITPSSSSSPKARVWPRGGHWLPHRRGPLPASARTVELRLRKLQAAEPDGGLRSVLEPDQPGCPRTGRVRSADRAYRVPALLQDRQGLQWA